MKPRTISGSKHRSRVDSSKHDPIISDTAATGSSNGSAATDAQGRIAALAYQLYEQRGRRDGHDMEDWLAAEQRVLVESNSQTAEKHRP